MTTVDESFEALLDHIRGSRGFDFSGYKRPTLKRRIERRMQVVGSRTYDDYRGQLDGRQDEFAALFDTILINVTSFFRDAPAWDYVAREIIPALVDSRAPDRPIRVWSTGCATGEEAYTIAMLLAERLGTTDFADRVKIYATDVDEAALRVGRHARFSQKDVQSVPDHLRERYFDGTDAGYVFSNDLRRCVIFGRNDLVQDPPISRIDLLLSRNTLMYFTPETQRQVLSNFYFALANDGYLMLGKSEMLLTRSDLFVPVDLRRRVFRKVSSTTVREQLRRFVDDDREPPDVDERQIQETAFELAPTPQLVIAEDGHLALANREARLLFNLSRRDLGRPLQDLEVSYRPIELRSMIDRAHSEGRSTELRGIETVRGTERRVYDVEVTPLARVSGGIVGTSIAFNDVTEHRHLMDSVERARTELESAYEELQATAEELETTNEELQSTNEELETTNEELQSTNEELETMNEELQSTNEELETINEELRRSSDELNQVNAFLESILASMHGGVVVVDTAFKVLGWNARSHDLWGLRYDEVEGEDFLTLDIGLPVAALRGPLDEVLAGRSARAETSLKATNRRGRAVELLLTCTPLVTSDGAVKGAIMVAEDLPPDS